MRLVNGRVERGALHSAHQKLRLLQKSVYRFQVSVRRVHLSPFAALLVFGLSLVSTTVYSLTRSSFSIEETHITSLNRSSQSRDVAQFVHRACESLRERYGDCTINANKAMRNEGHHVVDLVVFTEMRFNGFGAQFLRLVDSVAVARALDAPLIVHEAKYWNYGCAPYRGWSCYFDPPQGTADNTRNNAVRRARSKQCEELSVQHFMPQSGTHFGENTNARPCAFISNTRSTRYTHALLNHLSNNSVFLSRTLARQLWNLNSATQSEVHDVLHASGVSKLTGFYVGVHIRRGDKAKEVPNVDVEEYAKAVRIIAPSDTVSVFVASDDGSTVIRMRQLLAPRRVLSLNDVYTRKGHDQMVMNQMFLKKNRPRVISLLAEITALKKAKWFIGTFSSNLARTVHILRTAPPNSSLSLDDTWAPGVAWHTFGQPYCAFKDANSHFCASLQMKP